MGVVGPSLPCLDPAGSVHALGPGFYLSHPQARFSDRDHLKEGNPVEAEEMKRGVANIFLRAAAAHHRAVEKGQTEDEEWPLWYAGHALDGLRETLGVDITKSELVHLILTVHHEHEQQAPDSKWPEYYGRFFADRYAEPGAE